MAKKNFWKIEHNYNKSRNCLKKIVLKIEQMYNKIGICLEKKLKIGVTKIKVV